MSKPNDIGSPRPLTNRQLHRRKAKRKKQPFALQGTGSLASMGSQKINTTGRVNSIIKTMDRIKRRNSSVTLLSGVASSVTTVATILSAATRNQQKSVKSAPLRSNAEELLCEFDIQTQSWLKMFPSFNSKGHFSTGNSILEARTDLILYNVDFPESSRLFFLKDIDTNEIEGIPTQLANNLVSYQARMKSIGLHMFVLMNTDTEKAFFFGCGTFEAKQALMEKIETTLKPGHWKISFLLGKESIYESYKPYQISLRDFTSNQTEVFFEEQMSHLVSQSKRRVYWKKLNTRLSSAGVAAFYEGSLKKSIIIGSNFFLAIRKRKQSSFKIRSLSYDQYIEDDKNAADEYMDMLGTEHLPLLRQVNYVLVLCHVSLGQCDNGFILGTMVKKTYKAWKRKLSSLLNSYLEGYQESLLSDVEEYLRPIDQAL